MKGQLIGIRPRTSAAWDKPNGVESYFTVFSAKGEARRWGSEAHGLGDDEVPDALWTSQVCPEEIIGDSKSQKAELSCVCLAVPWWSKTCSRGWSSMERPSSSQKARMCLYSVEVILRPSFAKQSDADFEGRKLELKAYKRPSAGLSLLLTLYWVLEWFVI